MASYVSIKGWIECSDDDIKIIQENINNFWNNCPFNIEEKESAKIYKNGWVSRQIVLIGAAIFFLAHA